MHKQFTRELFISFGIIFGGLVVAAAAFFFLSRDITLQAESVATARQLITQRAATIEALADLKKSAPQAAAYATVLNKILAPQDQLLDFPRWFDGLARGRRLSLRFSFSGGQTPSSGKVPGNIGFSADMSGAMENIEGFLKDVELKPARFLLDFGSFVLSGGGADSNLSTNGEVYFR